MQMLFPSPNMFPFNFPQILNPNNLINPYNPIDDNGEDDEEPDPLLDNDELNLNSISPFILFEKPALIVKKNLFKSKWFLMKNDKILGSYDSEQLFFFLTSQIQQGNKFENMSISDFDTDVHFKPSDLYDILRKYVPLLKKRYLKKAMEQNMTMQMNPMNQINFMQLMNNNKMNMMNMNNMNMNNMNNINMNNINMNNMNINNQIQNKNINQMKNNNQNNNNQNRQRNQGYQNFHYGNVGYNNYNNKNNSKFDNNNNKNIWGKYYK